MYTNGVTIITSTKGKISVEEVDRAEWISAKVLILLELTAIKAYLCYIAKIGIYLQACQTPSVMKLDERHRKTWNKIENDQHFLFLKTNKKNC